MQIQTIAKCVVLEYIEHRTITLLYNILSYYGASNCSNGSIVLPVRPDSVTVIMHHTMAPEMKQ